MDASRSKSRYIYLLDLVLYWTVITSSSIMNPYFVSACENPSVSSTLYVLSTVSNSSDPGDVYEVVCVPGYKPDSVHRLVCDSSSGWNGTMPDCRKIDSGTRWWILFIVIVVLLVLIPCIVPRIYFRYNDERNVRRSKLLHERQREDDGPIGIMTIDGSGVSDNQMNLFTVFHIQDCRLQDDSPLPLRKRKL